MKYAIRIKDQIIKFGQLKPDNMEKRKERFYGLLPVVFIFGAFVAFYSRIACKPGDAGFWLIIALGMSIGVALTRFIQLSGIKKTDNK